MEINIDNVERGPTKCCNCSTAIPRLAAIKARFSNASKNYASAREQPYIEPDTLSKRDKAETRTRITPPVMPITIMGLTGYGESWFIIRVELCTAFSPNSTFTSNGLNTIFLDTPGFEDTNKSDTKFLQDVSSCTARSYNCGHNLAGIIQLYRVTEIGAELEHKDGRMPLLWAAENGHEEVIKWLIDNGAELDIEDTGLGRTPLVWAAENGHDEMVNSAIFYKEADSPDDGHERMALRYDLVLRKSLQSWVSFDSTADNFETHICCNMSCDWTTDPNHEVDLRHDPMRHSHCPDEEDMSSASSNDQESLFDRSPSESDTTTTVGSSAFRQELTCNSIEHMLAVLKAERRKCLAELQGFDSALETLDQLTNRNRPGSEVCFSRVKVL